MHASTLTNKPAAGYLRLSMLRDDSTSIPSQRRLVTGTAESHGIDRVVFFEDEGVSGSKDVKRPKRDEMEQRIAGGEFSAVIVKSVDRLARSTADFARIAKVCRDTETALIVSDLGVDSSTPGGKMVLDVLSALAEFEARMIGDRVRQGNAEKMQTGRVIGGPVPYGFRNVKRDGLPGTYREIDPDEASVVRRIVDHLLEGGSFRAIGRALEIEGIPTPRKSERGKARWSYRTVQRVVTNPAICGQTVFRGDVLRDEDGVPQVDPALQIITPGEFRLIQQRLDERAGAETRPQRREEDRLLLEGVAVCGACGRALRRMTTRGGRYVYYRCMSFCEAPAAVSAPALDEYVTDELLRLFGGVEIIERQEVADPEKVAALATVREEARAAHAGMTTATVEDAGTYFARWQALRARQEALEAEIGDALVPVEISTGETLRERWDAADSHVVRRNLVREFLPRVEVASAHGDRFAPLAPRVTLPPRQDDVESFEADLRRQVNG